VASFAVRDREVREAMLDVRVIALREDLAISMWLAGNVVVWQCLQVWIPSPPRPDSLWKLLARASWQALHLSVLTTALTPLK
jgi:hypothetical protein